MKKSRNRKKKRPLAGRKRKTNAIFDPPQSVNLDVPPESRQPELFLGQFTREEVEHVLVKSSLMGQLQKKGFGNLQVEIRPRGPYLHYISVHGQLGTETHLLGEALLRRAFLVPETPFYPPIHQKPLEMLKIEWLLLQNPAARFTVDRPPLPGQQFPGLGVGRKVVELLLLLARQLHLSGIWNVPQYFHNAQLYAELFHYLDPVKEGKRRAIARDLLGRNPLAKVSWAIDLACVWENNHPFQWFIGDQVVALSRELRKYFRSQAYREMRRDSEQRYQYHLDHDCWEQRNPLPQYFR